MGYHLTGAINTAFFLLALAGLVSQLARIWERRSQRHLGLPGAATAILSLNQFSVSFIGYFAFFVYGYSIEPFNHYLVWPRLVGSLLVLLVLFEIARDRRTGLSLAIFALASALMLAALAVLASGTSVSAGSRLAPQLLSIAASVLIVQGFGHQIVLIRRSGETGAVSARMHALSYCKDISTLVFGAAMGAGSGWPLILMGASSVGVKSILLWQFRWVNQSPLARQRRAQHASTQDASPSR
jgi:hypothetical protein